MWSSAVTYAFANKCIRDDTRSLRWPNLAEKNKSSTALGENRRKTNRQTYEQTNRGTTSSHETRAFASVGLTSCAARWPPQYAPRPTLTFDLLTLKSVWESHVTWGTAVQSFVFLGLLVFELEPMYATSDGQTDGQTDDGRR